MMFVVYFVVSESLAIKKEGRAYFTLWGNYGQWVFILLTTCTVLVHLSQATLADQQWLRYLSNRRGFTNFYQVAFLSSVFSSLAASLLFLLSVQVTGGLGEQHVGGGCFGPPVLVTPAQSWQGQSGWQGGHVCLCCALQVSAASGPSIPLGNSAKCG